MNFQTQLNRLTNPLHELVKRAGLSVTPRQFWNAGDVVTFFVAFNNDTELSLVGSPHEHNVPKKKLLRKEFDAALSDRPPPSTS